MPDCRHLDLFSASIYLGADTWSSVAQLVENGAYNATILCLNPSYT